LNRHDERLVLHLLLDRTAAQALRANEHLFVRALGRGDADALQIRLEPPTARSDIARITVDDDGPGIPADNLESIFKRFYTKRPAGSAFGNNSGLGLAISRQIVNSHAGRIYAENRLSDPANKDSASMGARFIVELPGR